MQLWDDISFWEYQPTESQLMAEYIMGENFLGVANAHEYLSVQFKEMEPLAEVPWTKEELMGKYAWLLGAVPAISLADLRKREPSFFEDNAWYQTHAFALNPGRAGWHMISKVPVGDLTTCHYLLSSQTLVYLLLLASKMYIYCHRIRAPIFGNCLFLSSDADDFGYRVGVRYYEGKLSIQSYFKDKESEEGFIKGMAVGKRPCPPRRIIAAA